MKTLNRMLEVVFVAVLFVSSLALAGTVFVRSSLTQQRLEKLAASLSLKDFIEPGTSDELNQIVANFIDSPELKDILTTYGYGLLEYVVEGQTEVSVSKEQEIALVEAHQDAILAAIPGANLIPADRIVDFILQNLDLNTLLPSYAEVMTQIPSEYVTILRVFNSSTLLYGLVALMLASIIALGLVKRHVYHWLRPTGLTFLAAGLICLAVPWLVQASAVLDAYQMGNIDGMVMLALSYFDGIAFYMIISGLVMVLISWLLDRYMKKQYR